MANASQTAPSTAEQLPSAALPAMNPLLFMNPAAAFSALLQQQQQLKNGKIT